jgi:hypothetical protein
MPDPTPRQALSQLENLKFTFDRNAARAKRTLLTRLERAVLTDADEVLRLHEMLCFLRAYPDDRALLNTVLRMLRTFETREDLVEQRKELVDSGIAGTEIHFPFYWFTFDWVARRWPDRLRIDWSAAAKGKALLDRRLSMLMPYCETLGLEEAVLTTREWIECLKGPDETDGAFVARRYRALRAEPMTREALFEEMDLSFRLLPGPDTPTQTRNHREISRVAFQKRPFVQTRDTFRKDLERPPRSVQNVSRGEARKLIEMARVLMVVRSRDLDCFVHASEDDVRLLDYGDGLQFVSYGSRPERRQMLDAAYGFLMLKNGAPIGYVLSASLFGSSEIAFNVSPSFRGAEASRLYAQTLSVVRHLFDVDTFVVDPYQMGHENLEGLKSGAWWFYYKLGFRPKDAAILRLAGRELEKLKSKRGHRTGIATLNRLSSVNMYLYLDEPRDGILGLFARENIGLSIVRYLARRFGGDREKGLEACSREAARLLGLGSLAGLSPGERLAWERWAPLVLQLPGIEDWSVSDRSAVARVVRAKGGRRESDFVHRFDRHRRLRQALFDLAREAPPLPVD